jgi:hypothetical protein
VWTVQDGGRVGAVVGEDAAEALALEAPRAQKLCPTNDVDN